LIRECGTISIGLFMRVHVESFFSPMPLRVHPCCSSVIVVALAIILVWHSALANDALHVGSIDEKSTLQHSSFKDDHSSDTPGPLPSAAAGDDDDVVTWARGRLSQLREQRKDTAATSPPPPVDDRPGSFELSANLIELLNSDSEAFTSPEDIRNLFYSDAARAEVQTANAVVPTLYFRNTLHSPTCCKATAVPPSSLLFLNIMPLSRRRPLRRRHLPQPPAREI
jgi:hypothetical protein